MTFTYQYSLFPSLSFQSLCCRLLCRRLTKERRHVPSIFHQMDFLHVIKVTLARLCWGIWVVLFQTSTRASFKQFRSADDKCKEGTRGIWETSSLCFKCDIYHNFFHLTFFAVFLRFHTFKIFTHILSHISPGILRTLWWKLFFLCCNYFKLCEINLEFLFQLWDCKCCLDWFACWPFIKWFMALRVFILIYFGE